MIKRTLYFGNPAYLSLQNGQLVIKLPEVEQTAVPDFVKQENIHTVPIEDIGIMVLDHRRITLTQGLLEALLDNNVALLTCSASHMPIGLLLPMEGNTTLTERWRVQMEASLPLKKQLWQQTVQQKIQNQAATLKAVYGMEVKNMYQWANEVRSGDNTNLEGRAANYYWKYAFPSIEGFTRGQDGDYPNHLLNYGYAVLRAVIARALVSSGLLVQMGIHHKNKYNAYCLADDIMEPYRPYVDRVVMDMVKQEEPGETLSKEQKVKLLNIPTMEVYIDGRRSPLEVAASTTTASVYKCFAGEIRKILYPEMQLNG
ncbi:MAG: type II CRISPR-associated endonuclease Cas1 [Bacteroidales bacterium]|nr:type II CRISPR-associated endonuclease Cas1 [Bacteroidales bacterium]